MPRRRLTDIATRHQVFLERYKVTEANELAKVFDMVNVETRRVIRQMNVPAISDVSRTKLKAILAELRQINLDLLTSGTDQLFENLNTLASYEAGFELRTFGSIDASVRLTEPKAGEAYDAALKQPLSVNGDLLQPFVAKWTVAEADRVTQTIQKAWGEGWTTDALTSAINGTKAANYADGILGIPGSTAAVARRNARTIARTSIQHVASTARMKTWEDNADVITGYRFVATLDSRTTQQCRSLDGKLFELGAGPVPPIHPNCRSTTVAEVDPSLSFLDKGATRSSEDGYVSADLDYYDWLKTQSAEFQNEAIGPTRAELFRKGGLTSEEFSALNLNRNFQPLTLAEMQKLEPVAFEKAGIKLPQIKQ